jgi:dipeptidyl aminopeptidase/acylaminoacyl peptidase
MSIRLCAAFLLCCSLGSLAAGPQAIASGGAGADSLNVPPIETFMKIGGATAPQISEDGSQVFFESWMSGVTQVYKLLPSGWPYQLTLFDDGIDFYRVSYSGDWMVVGASIGGSEQSDLYLINTETGVMRTLKADDDVRHGMVVWSPDEEYVYYSANEPDPMYFMIYRISLQDGSIETIWDKQGWSGTADVSADGRYLLIDKYESNTNNNLWLLDLESGEETLLTEHQGDYTFDYGRLSKDADAVYCVTNMNDDGTKRVARLDVKSKKIEFVMPDTPWETEEMDLSRNGIYLVWLENIEGYGMFYGRNLETDAQIEICLTLGVLSGLQVSTERTVVASFSSPSEAPDIWEYHADTGELSKLTFSTMAGIDPSLLSDPEMIRYESFDGLEIPAFLYLPADYEGGPIPFIIHAHGGPEGQFRPSFNRHFQYLILHGYGILAPNIRGSKGYGREFMALDDYKKRKDSVRDIYEGAMWLVENGYAEKGKIGIKGGSYGGYMTLAALVDYPDVFGAGIDDVGIANFVTFLENTKSYRRAIREAEYGPLSDPEFLTEISPLTHADRIKAPLLIVHGENDSRVPVGEARQIADAIEANGGVVETLIFPDEGHGISKLDNRLIYYRKMVDFLDQHLK